MRLATTKLFVMTLLLGSAAPDLLAYNPPVDTAGPLTVRIDGPEVVTKTETPLPVRVIIRNKSDRAIRGTLRLGLIDRWQAEPAGDVPFSVEGKGSAQRIAINIPVLDF